MRSLLVFNAVILVQIAVVYAIGRGIAPYWRPDAGLAMLNAAALISVISGLAGLAPLLVIVKLRPDYAGPAALSATTLRLLLTAGLMFAYQTFAPNVDVPTFMIWLAAFYLSTLVTETLMAVSLGRRFTSSPSADQG